MWLWWDGMGWILVVFDLFRPVSVIFSEIWTRGAVWSYCHDETDRSVDPFSSVTPGFPQKVEEYNLLQPKLEQ